MKNTLIVLNFLFFSSLVAQDSLKFISTVYVKDAIGNIDSVVIGTSYYANNVYNPNFGELKLTTPFDSILDVRSGHSASTWDFFEPDYNLSKKTISSSEELSGKSGVGIRIFIYAKYQPVTISWSDEFLDPKYFLGTYITPDANMGNVNPITYWETFPIRFQCMNKFTSYMVELKSQAVPEFEFPYFVVRSVLGSPNSTDSIYGVEIFFEQHEMYSPCQLVSGVEENLEQRTVDVYPNPAFNYIRLSENLDKVDIFDLSGRWVRDIPGGEDFYIGDLQAGVYVLKSRVSDKWLSGRLVKI